MRFDRVHVLNLDRRPDRLAAFWDRWAHGAAEAWRLAGQPPPGRAAAVDGRLTGKPSWFDQQAGAWGCLRSHLRLWEDAIAGGHDVFVFEDDVVFSDDFAGRIGPFLGAVPEDWQMVYLGGLHRMPAAHPPVSLPGGGPVHLGRAITTTYAYGVRGSFLPELYRAVHEAEQHHIDQMLARLMVANTWRVYCPVPWLCGMDEGMSDICGRYYQKPHFWEYTPQSANQPIHLLQLISRQRGKRRPDGEGMEWRDVDLTAPQRRRKWSSNIGGWFSDECGAAYRRECQGQARARPGMACQLVEVGCWRGRSLSYLVDMVASGMVRATAVDTWRGNSTPTDPTHEHDVYEDFRANMERLGIAPLVEVRRSPSVEEAGRWREAGRQADIVMIDADHEYAHVRADLAAWWPRVRPGGVLMGHDYSPACACPGVVRAVDEFARDKGLAVEAEADLWIVRKPG